MARIKERKIPEVYEKKKKNNQEIEVKIDINSAGLDLISSNHCFDKERHWADLPWKVFSIKKKYLKSL